MRLLRVIPFLFLAFYSCHAQNGPTQPSVVLTLTASTTPGVTAYCVYRGTVAGTYATPGNCFPATQLTYTDSTVAAGTTYYYASTAQIGASEGPYLTPPLQVPVPVAPAPPGLTPKTVTENKMPAPPAPVMQGLLCCTNFLTTAPDLQAKVIWKTQ
jgi:hypothetical protein